MSNHRETTNHDILNYLQENNAYLKTILSHLESNSSDPIAANTLNNTNFEKFLEQTKNSFQESRKFKK